MSEQERLNKVVSKFLGRTVFVEAAYYPVKGYSGFKVEATTLCMDGRTVASTFDIPCSVITYGGVR